MWFIKWLPPEEVSYDAAHVRIIVHYHILIEPFLRINPDLVILELWEDYHARWYDLYNHLGLKHEVLEHLMTKYKKDPKVCMHEATRLWFDQGDPKPSWEKIVQVLRYKLLEPEKADRLEAILGLTNQPNPLIGRGAGI